MGGNSTFTNNSEKISIKPKRLDKNDAISIKLLYVWHSTTDDD